MLWTHCSIVGFPRWTFPWLENTLGNGGAAKWTLLCFGHGCSGTWIVSEMEPLEVLAKDL